MQIEYNKCYLLDGLELTIKRINGNVYTFNIINKELIFGVCGLMNQTCIISQRINELKINENEKK